MLIDSLKCDIMIHVGYMHNISAGSGYMHISRKLEFWNYSRPTVNFWHRINKQNKERFNNVKKYKLQTNWNIHLSAVSTSKTHN